MFTEKKPNGKQDIEEILISSLREMKEEEEKRNLLKGKPKPNTKRKWFVKLGGEKEKTKEITETVDSYGNSRFTENNKTSHIVPGRIEREYPSIASMFPDNDIRFYGDEPLKQAKSLKYPKELGEAADSFLESYNQTRENFINPRRAEFSLSRSNEKTIHSALLNELFNGEGEKIYASPDFRTLPYGISKYPQYVQNVAEGSTTTDVRLSNAKENKDNKKYFAKVKHTPRPAHVSKFINRVLPVAKQVKEEYGIPIPVTIAIGALETWWGRKVKDNAYFGVKAHKTKGATTSFETTEFINKNKVKLTDSFRAYKNIEEAGKDFGKFLTSNSKYKKALLHPSEPYKFANELKSYATDPNYVKKLKSIIKHQHLEEYDK